MICDLFMNYTHVSKSNVELAAKQ